MNKPCKDHLMPFTAELESLLKKVDCGLKAKGLNGPALEEARILAKISVLEEFMVEHQIPFVCDQRGNVVIENILKAIGHFYKAKRTTQIRLSLRHLNSRHGRLGPIRHSPERPIDLSLDDYEARINARGYGPPRSSRMPHQLCRTGSAEEIGCKLKGLDKIARARLEQIASRYPDGPISSSEHDGIRYPRRVNHALERLLRNEIERLREVGLPEDPLDEGTVDLNTLCRGPGISTADLKEIPNLQQFISEAQTTMKLVKHPLIAARRFSFGELIAWARDEGREVGEGEPGIATRKQVFMLRQYIRSLDPPGGGEEALVPYDFRKKLEAAMRNSQPEFDHGWRGLVADWAQWSDLFRATKPLPECFAVALRILCLEASQMLQSLIPLSDRGLVVKWADGLSVPSARSEKRLKEMAKTLRTPLDVLKSSLDERHQKRLFVIDGEAFPTASRYLPLDFEMIEDEAEINAILTENHWRFVRQGTDFTRKSAVRKADQYLLPWEEWNPEMQVAWTRSLPMTIEELSPLRRIGDPLRKRDADGQVEKPEDPWRDKTVEFRRTLLACLFGFCRRPLVIKEVNAEIVAAAARSATKAIGTVDPAGQEDQLPEFVFDGGLGIPVGLLKPGILVVTDLVLAFNWWKTRRAGMFVKTLPMTIAAVMRMLKPETGPVWRDETMLADLEALKAHWDENPPETADAKLNFDIEPFRGDWRAAVAKAYETLSDDLGRAKEFDFKPSRDSFLSVGVFIDHHLPMELYYEGVRNLLDSRPHDVTSRHVHVRDCLQTLILIQTGLRTYNMMLTVDDGDPPTRRRIGRNKKELPATLRKLSIEGEDIWRITIPASEFKNSYGPYFKDDQPYELELEDGICSPPLCGEGRATTL